jgi:hypothetical protein
MKQTLTLTTKQAQCLTDITRASTSPQRLVQRANMILGYARSGNQSAVAKAVKVDRELCVSGSLVGAQSGRILNAWKPCVKPSSYQLACTVERSSASSAMLPALVRRQRSARRRSNKSSPWPARLLSRLGCTGYPLEPRTPSPNSHHERYCTIHLCSPSRAFFN